MTPILLFVYIAAAFAGIAFGAIVLALAYILALAIIGSVRR